MNYELTKLRYFKDKFGSEYDAAMYVAKAARKLMIKSHNLLSESEAIDWIISQKPDKDLQIYIEKHKHKLRERRYNVINEYASMIDSRSVRIQFQKSAAISNQEKHLIIDYGNLDIYDCSRLRILMKEYWLDHLKNDISDIFIV